MPRRNHPKTVIVHCSATPDDGKDRFGVAEIDTWHRARGFKSCGYHIVIRQSGLIEFGRPLHEIGAHCKGHNTDSIGVCFIGTSRPEQIQIVRFMNLYVKFKEKYDIGYHAWTGHYELNDAKLCPGFPMEMLRTLLMLYDCSHPDL